MIKIVWLRFDTIDTGYIVRYNQKAAAEAFRMSREFLEEWL